jgi:hypothetical protein
MSDKRRATAPPYADCWEGHRSNHEGPGWFPAQYEPGAAKDVPFLQQTHAGVVTGRQGESGHEIIPKMVDAYLV